MNQEEAIEYLISNPKCFDRFAFEYNMRLLLKTDFTHNEAKDLILNFCSLSALVFEERIQNNYYLRINKEILNSDDLIELKIEIIRKILLNPN